MSSTEKLSRQVNYTFEEGYNRRIKIPEQFISNKKLFCDHLGIDKNAKFSKEEKIVLDAFFRDNIYNIVWYRKRIKKENRAVNWYFGFTLLVLLGVPFLIFMTTLGAWSDNVSVKNLGSMEKIGSGITVMVSALLALHKFTSTWIDRRKFSAQFHQAGVELKDILYELQGNYFGNAALGEKSFTSLQRQHYFGDDFFIALKQATKLSEAVVDAETTAFFEKKANPSFDIAGIWRSSASAAAEAFGSFKSGTWKIEELREKVKSQRQTNAETKNEIEKKEQQRQVAMMKLQRMGKQEETLSLQMDELELRQATLTAPDINHLGHLKIRFDKLQGEIDETEFSVRVLDIEIAQLRGDEK